MTLLYKNLIPSARRAQRASTRMY